MQTNKLVYGSWVLLLLCAVCVAALNMKSIRDEQQTETETSLGQEGRLTDEPLLSDDQSIDEGLQVVAFQDDAPGKLPIVAKDDPLAETKLKELRRIVAEEWPDATEEQIRIWAEDFSDVPEDGFRLMLRQKRATMGSMPSLLDRKPIELPKPPVAGGTSRTLRKAREVIQSNMMHRHTIGHRARVVEFAPNGPDLEVAEIRFVTRPGKRRETGNPLDLAVSSGFFVVKDGERRFFTRAGRFHLNSDRRLALKIGDRELLVCGVDAIPADTVPLKVNAAGDVTGGNDGETPLGRIVIERFLDPSRLKSEGGCLFEETPESGPPSRLTGRVVSQGVLELTNGDEREHDVLLAYLKKLQELNAGLE